jgi:large subunit ribosomal protein L15e
MGIYKNIRNLWQNPTEEVKAIWRDRLISWRKENSVVRIERPTRLDRARSLGYKPKKGILIVRVKLPRGGRQRQKPAGGRRSKNMRRKFILGKNYQWIAEERANKKYVNCEVLNSYFVAKDGKHYWYEVILVERAQVSSYKGMEWLTPKGNRGRVYRGKTAAGRRSRGILTNKGKGAEKLRPSLRANKRRGTN